MLKLSFTLQRNTIQLSSGKEQSHPLENYHLSLSVIMALVLCFYPCTLKLGETNDEPPNCLEDEQMTDKTYFKLSRQVVRPEMKRKGETLCARRNCCLTRLKTCKGKACISK